MSTLYGPAPKGHSCEHDGWCQAVHPARGNVYMDMCPGSEGRQVMFMGPMLQCSSCDQWLPAYRGSFLAPVHSTAGILACHQACPSCWNDFAVGRNTDHACSCDECTPRLPADHRWTDSCSCSSCLPERA